MRKHSPTRKLLPAVLVLAWMLPNAGLRAQEKKQEAGPQKQAGEAAKQVSSGERIVQKVIRLKHIDGRELVSLFGFWGTMAYSDELNVITFVGHESAAAELAAAIKELDVPPGPDQRQHRTAENVEIIFHLLGVSDEVSSEPIPDLLKDVVRELKGTFPYKNYQLLETALVRTRVSQPRSPAIAEVGGVYLGTRPDAYQLSVEVKGVSGTEGSHIIELEQLSFEADLSVEVAPASEKNRYPVYRDKRLSILANVNVPEGKTVVVGKAGAGGVTRGIFLVLTAKVVD